MSRPRREAPDEGVHRGASGKLGQYMVQHALDRGYEVAGVCREESVGKLDGFKGRISILAGATNDAEVIKKAVAGCEGVLVALVPRGVHGYATGTAGFFVSRESRTSWPTRWHWLRLTARRMMGEAQPRT